MPNLVNVGRTSLGVFGVLLAGVEGVEDDGDPAGGAAAGVVAAARDDGEETTAVETGAEAATEVGRCLHLTSRRPTLL